MANFGVTRNQRPATPPPGRWRDVQQALIDVQGQRESQQAVEGMVRTHEFRVPVLKYGLVKNIDCRFSFLFLHQPQFRAEFVLENQGFVFPQFLPKVEAAVIDWEIPNGDTDQATNLGVEWGLYYGAMVTATVSGHMFQRGFIHLSFTGKTLVYPVANTQRDATFTRPPAEYEDEPAP